MYFTSIFSKIERSYIDICIVDMDTFHGNELLRPVWSCFYLLHLMWFRVSFPPPPHPPPPNSKGISGHVAKAHDHIPESCELDLVLWYLRRPSPVQLEIEARAKLFQETLPVLRALKLLCVVKEASQFFVLEKIWPKRHWILPDWIPCYMNTSWK